MFRSKTVDPIEKKTQDKAQISTNTILKKFKLLGSFCYQTGEPWTQPFGQTEEITLILALDYLAGCKHPAGDPLLFEMCILCFWKDDQTGKTKPSWSGEDISSKFMTKLTDCGQFWGES